MDKSILDRLTALGTFEKLDRGERGVRVSLQSRVPLAAGSSAERHARLREAFAQLAGALVAKGARVELDTISVSAQTVEAVLPVDRYDELKQRLEDDGIRVDPVLDRQIV